MVGNYTVQILGSITNAAKTFAATFTQTIVVYCP